MEETLNTIEGGLDSLRERLAAEGVRYLLGAYVDIHGVAKSKVVPITHFDNYAGGSERYTVGALEGMGILGPHEDECLGIPDIGKLTVLPWDRRYALAPADLHFEGTGAPYSHDSRHVLKVQIAKAAELGYRVNLGIEPELYILRETEDGGFEPWAKDDTINKPTRGYDVDTTFQADTFLEPMVEYMDELGWKVYSFDHEGGDSQYEFDFAYTEALEMADRMLVFRLMAKHVARTLGAFASFMPKPTSTAFGSGAHLNMSLADLDGGDNAFSAANGGGRNGYTELAYHFTAGLLKHAPAITALACSTVNSYKRLLPIGHMNEISWAPVYAAYGDNNRTLMCRLPSGRQCVELRTADMGSNFYLVAAAMLGAGLEGIRQKLEPGDAVNLDTYSLDDTELAARGVHRLPRNLGEACDALERDELLRDILGAEFHKTYIAYKREEWRAYNTVVGQWEIDQYLRLW